MKALIIFLFFIPLLSFSQVDSNYVRIRTKVPLVLTDSPASRYGKIAVANVSQDENLYGASLVKGEYGKYYWHVYYDGLKGYIEDDTFYLSYARNIRYYYESKGLNDDIERMLYASKAALADATRELARLKSAIAVKSKLGLFIEDWGWDYENSYSSAFDFNITLTNYSKKSIKYIWFTLAAYDAVDGRLTSFGKTTTQMKGIGPIGYLESASFDFDRVFYSRVVETVKILKIRVQYMDNSFRDFDNINSLM